MSASTFDPELEELFHLAVGRLQNAEVFDFQAFERLLRYLDTKAEAIKSEHVVSKQVLHHILWTAKSLEGAHSLPAQASVLIPKLYELVDLIAIGEAPSDRKAGIPRVT